MQLNLIGFGRFFWQQHKGHKPFYAKTDHDDAEGAIDDDTVVRFSATRQSNQFVSLTDEDLREVQVPALDGCGRFRRSSETSTSRTPDEQKKNPRSHICRGSAFVGLVKPFDTDHAVRFSFPEGTD